MKSNYRGANQSGSRVRWHRCRAKKKKKTIRANKRSSIGLIESNEPLNGGCDNSLCTAAVTGMPLLFRLYDRGNDGIRDRRPVPVDAVGVVRFSELVLAAFECISEHIINFKINSRYVCSKRLQAINWIKGIHYI